MKYVTLLSAVLLTISPLAQSQAQKEITTQHATGTFEVKIVPETVAGKPSSPGLSQMSIDKTFHGDLEGSSVGSMISAGDPKAGDSKAADSRASDSKTGLAAPEPA